MQTNSQPIDVAQSLRLAQGHFKAGRLDDAERICRDLLKAEPCPAEAWHLLGAIAQKLGNHEMAVELIEEAIRLEPSRPDYQDDLGNAYLAQDRAGEAERCYRAALSLDPDFLASHNNLGIALRELGRLEEAEQSFRQAIGLKPDYIEAHSNLGNVLRELGQLEQAERSLNRALALKSDSAETHGNLGIVLRGLGRLEEAERSFRRALALQPRFAEAHNDLGAALFGLGRLEEAERCYRDALALKPAFPIAHRNLVFLLNFVAGRAPAEIYAEHREFARRFYASGDSGPHGNVPDPERPLRVGYVSGDLRFHPVAFFIEPVLAGHDRKQFEVFCYHSSPQSDALTQRLKSYGAQWRDVHAMNDEALVKLIRDDGIDILVDLSGHTINGRLHVFSRRPAPVQVSWLGYPATTGLAAMDYRLTDAIADPPGESERWFTERLMRLPECMWCYRPHDALAAVGPPPMLACGRATYGSFSNYAKLNSQVIALWARLLGRVPESRLIVTRVPGEQTQAVLRRRLAESGISGERLELHANLPRDQFSELLSRIDIVLDPFPYAGTTTTCDVLWLGIPVVTLSGETTASRSGASLLHAVGLEELVAQTPDQYVEIAAALAQDPARLAAMRAGLRERMRSSPLMDADRFSRNLEAAFRTMWRSWCSARSGGTIIHRIRAKLRELRLLLV